MLEVLGSAAVRIVVLAVLLQLSLTALRIRHPKLLRVAWSAVLIASLAMPALQRSVPIALPISVEQEPSVGDVAFPQNANPQRVASETRAIATTHEAPAWPLWLNWGYLAVSAAMFARLLTGVVLSWRLSRTGRPLCDGWAAGSRVRASAAVAVPVTLGNTIILPADCILWSDGMRQAVLAHEQAHVVAGDFYVQLLSQVNRAVFWFSPVSWWLHWRLAALAELVSDNAAIEVLGDRPGYAKILLDIAQRSRSPIRGVAMARFSTVSSRIERILGERGLPMRIGLRQQAAVAVGVMSLAFMAGQSIAGAVPPGRAGLADQQEPHTRITIDPKLLDAYSGFYRNPETGSLMIVARDGDHLMTRRAGNPPVPEFPYTDRDFFLTIAPQQNSFVTDASGAVVRVVHHQMGRDETLERISVEVGQQDLAKFEHRLAVERSPHTEINIDPKLLDGYVGAYQLTPRLIFVVTREGDALYARLTGQQTYQLHPYGDRDFFYTVVAAQLSFVPGPDGKATAVILHQEGRDRTAPRVDPASAQALDSKLEQEREPHNVVSLAPHLIDNYVGRYRNADLGMFITREGSQLFAQVAGRGRYPIYPYTSRDFFATIIPAQISFVTNTTGTATQLIRHQFGVDAVLNRVD